MIFVCSTVETPRYSLEGEYEIILPHNTERPNIFNKIAYRHLRHMYYVWKNLAIWNYPDEIGIFQERRRLKQTHIPIGYDAVLPPQDNILPVYAQWWTCRHDPNHKMEYLEALIGILPGFKRYSEIPNNPYARFHNIGVFPVEMYKQLCSFLFGTLRRLEDEIDVDPEGDIHTYAFLGERIADYWFWNHSSIKVYESPIVKLDKIS